MIVFVQSWESKSQITQINYLSPENFAKKQSCINNINHNDVFQDYKINFSRAIIHIRYMLDYKYILCR